MAWDNPRENIYQKFRQIAEWIPPYKILVYILIGFWSTEEEDLNRVRLLSNLGYGTYIMPFNKKDKYQKKFARWVNHKAIFKSVKWEDYNG